MKSVYKIILISALAVIIVLGIYFGWQKILGSPEVSPPVSDGREPATTTPATLLSFKKLSEEKVFDFWVSGATGEVYYLTLEGRVLIAKDGPDLGVSNQTLNALNSIEVGPDGRKILAAFGDPKAPSWGIFDVVDKVWRPLPNEITNAAWGRDEDKLMVLVKNGSELNLAEADLARTPPAYRILIRDFRLKDVKMTYLPPERLVVGEKTSAFYAGRIWQLDLNTLNFNLLFSPEEGLSITLADDKNFAFLSGKSSGFLILDAALEVTSPVPFTSFSKKCNSGGGKIYCFVPQTVYAGLNLPDDYLSRRFFSIDDLFSVDASLGIVEKIIAGNIGGWPAFDGQNPRFLNGRLYFINRYDESLYEIRL